MTPPNDRGPGPSVKDPDVYEAEQDNPRRTVALKVAKSASLTSPLTCSSTMNGSP